jgi:hypothetical protein
MSTVTGRIVLRGNLSKKPELIEFFKFLDTKTPKEFLGQLYYDPTNPQYRKGYRPTYYGTIEAAMEKFKVERPTILSRIRLYPKGVTEVAKPTQKGAKPVTYEKWELTPTHKAIIEKIPETWDVAKQRLTAKGNKYDNPLYRAWLITKTDPFDMTIDQWLLLWGKQPKTPDSVHPEFKDTETHLISYPYATAFRWAMLNSVDPEVKDLIVTKDARFDTKKLKKPKGKHKEEYLNEDQCLLLPNGIHRPDTLMLSYYGILFGGRFEALNALTPAKVKRDIHKLIVYESKIEEEVEKSIYEPETSFMWQYIVDYKIPINKPMFPRNITSYNDELKAAAKEAFKGTPFELIGTDGIEWELTTHRAFKHTCVTEMSLHGVRMDTISTYIGTDPDTLNDFYRGGSEETVDEEIGGIPKERHAPTWRAFVIKLTEVYRTRYKELMSSNTVA